MADTHKRMKAAWPYPFWIAHRGAGKLAPENTLAAFREGARQGYRAFECDVKLSADDVPFLLHDSTLERTTSGQGVAGERNWSELSRLDAGSWHSPAYAGEPIPSLAAIAHFVRHNGFSVNLEIKPTPGLEERTGRIVAEEAVRLWQGDDKPPLLSAFEPVALAAARAAAPDLPRALLVDRFRDDWIEEALALGCVAVVTATALMDALLMARLRKAKLRALTYTVNEPAEAQRLLMLRIDGVITDAVDRFSAQDVTVPA